MGRARYVTNTEFWAVHAKADATLQDAMCFASLTHQRPADVLKIQRTDVRDGALFIAQNKTGAKRAIEITGELATLTERITSRSRQRGRAFLIQDANGRPLSMLAMPSRFDKARKDTGDLGHSQRLLGHRNRKMTEHYVRERIGQRVKPLR